MHARVPTPTGRCDSKVSQTMSLSLYQSSVPTFERCLRALIVILDKAELHANARKFDPANYLGMRLAPDMFPFVRQVQSACDNAKNGSARLAGVQAPAFEDKEATFAELRDRIGRTLDYLATLDAKAIDAGMEREIVFPAGPSVKFRMQGGNYLLHWVLPNFYFHLTTAYDILRAAGVEIGKRDFLGAVLGIEQV
jgi:uncharacterized protein